MLQQFKINSIHFFSILLCCFNSACFLRGQEGLARDYLSDGNIPSHNAVLYATDFNDNEWIAEDFKNCTAHFLAQKDSKRPRFNDSISLFEDGTGSLELRQYKGDNGPRPLRIVLPDSLQNMPRYFLRWYQKFDEGYTFNFQKGTRLGGRNDGDRMNPGCGYSGGVRYMSWSVNLVPNGNAPEYWPRAYFYHNNDQSCGTDVDLPNPVSMPKAKWTCIEIMVQQNKVGKKNGEGKIWVNGKEVLHIADIEFRTTDDLYFKWIEFYGGNGKKTRTASQNQSHYIDNVVLATEYIGPIKK